MSCASIEVAAACLAAAQRFHLTSRAAFSESAPQAVSVAPEAAHIIAAARQAGRSSLLEPEALRLLANYGVRTPHTAGLFTPVDAAALPAELQERPVALKIVSQVILHKSDVGGVRLGITGAQAIEREAAALLAHVRRECPQAAVAGVLVTPMAEGALR